MWSKLAIAMALVTLSRPAWPQSGLPDLTLIQYDWGDVATGEITPNTRMGAFRFHFTADDTACLRANGGTFVNVALYNNATQTVEWVIRNLYLAFPDVGRMVGQEPAVPFGLGLPRTGGAAWSLSVFAFSLTAAPLTAPQYTHVRWQVPVHELHANGGLAPEGESLVPPPPIHDAIGPFEAFQGSGSGIETADILVPVSDIPEINELPSHCAPAAVARSIAYMAGCAGASLPQTPQDMSDTLAGLMNTHFILGTTMDRLLDGKLAYTEEFELPICTGMYLGWEEYIDWVMDHLNGGCDVEVLFPRHCAMLTGVMQGPTVTVITTVDDQNQFDFTASNDVQVDVVYPGGACPSKGGIIRGFLVECWGLCADVDSDVAY